MGIEGLDTAYQSSVGWEGEAIRALDKGYGGDFFSQVTCISTLVNHLIYGVYLSIPTRGA